MSAKIETFPYWKSNATAEERFSELMMEAKVKPERFTKVLVVYVEITKEGRWKPRIASTGNENDFERLGLLSTAMTEIENEMRK